MLSPEKLRLIHEFETKHKNYNIPLYDIDILGVKKYPPNVLRLVYLYTKFV